MTFGQYASACHWGTDRHREYLDQAETVGKRRSAAMPYAGWETLAFALKQEAFTKWGKGRPSKLTGDAKGTRSVLHCIERHLTTLTSHPALQMYAVVGCSEQLLTVWWTGWHWSLSPQRLQPGLEGMWVLYPEYLPTANALSDRPEARVAFNTDLTVWERRPWSDEYLAYDLFPEVEHLNWQT